MKKPIQIRVDETDLYTWMKLAKESGLGLSAWIRMRCNEQMQYAEAEKREVVKKAKKVDQTVWEQTGAVKTVEPNPRPGRCPHYKMKGEVCYKCDAKWGYPNLD